MNKPIGVRARLAQGISITKIQLGWAVKNLSRPKWKELMEEEVFKDFLSAAFIHNPGLYRRITKETNLKGRDILWGSSGIPESADDHNTEGASHKAGATQNSTHSGRSECAPNSDTETPNAGVDGYQASTRRCEAEKVGNTRTRGTDSTFRTLDGNGAPNSDTETPNAGVDGDQASTRRCEAEKAGNTRTRGTDSTSHTLDRNGAPKRRSQPAEPDHQRSRGAKAASSNLGQSQASMGASQNSNNPKPPKQPEKNDNDIHGSSSAYQEPTKEQENSAAEAFERKIITEDPTVLDVAANDMALAKIGNFPRARYDHVFSYCSLLNIELIKDDVRKYFRLRTGRPVAGEHATVIDVSNPLAMLRDIDASSGEKVYFAVRRALVLTKLHHEINNRADAMERDFRAPHPNSNFRSAACEELAEIQAGGKEALYNLPRSQRLRMIADIRNKHKWGDRMLQLQASFEGIGIFLVVAVAGASFAIIEQKFTRDHLCIMNWVAKRMPSVIEFSRRCSPSIEEFVARGYLTTEQQQYICPEEVDVELDDGNADEPRMDRNRSSNPPKSGAGAGDTEVAEEDDLFVGRSKEASDDDEMEDGASEDEESERDGSDDEMDDEDKENRAGEDEESEEDGSDKDDMEDGSDDDDDVKDGSDDDGMESGSDKDDGEDGSDDDDDMKDGSDDDSMEDGETANRR